MAYGWAGTVGEFLDEEHAALGVQLADEHTRYYSQDAAVSQRSAWTTEVRVLRESLAAIPRARPWGLLIEYELAFEGGRRVDKIALAGRNVVALEFKETSKILRSDLDQVRAYARDLSEYHSVCRDREVSPLLVLPNRPDVDTSIDGTRVVGPPGLGGALQELAGPEPSIPMGDWLQGSYAPLPTLVEAARRVFQDEPLPAIRRAESAGVPKLLEWLHALVERAKVNGERHLVLIAGVPGSGKTLVGLQFVHERGEPGEAQAVFLSGNGPLVEVLQHALKGHKVFVRPMRAFILQYGVRTKSAPPHHVLVFDEAQRAWDVGHVQLKHGHAQSEPEMLIEIAGRLPGWSVVVGLVGEGQEIHLGEESGLGQWRDAIQHAGPTTVVHVPPHLATEFDGQNVYADPVLNLTLSLRTHRAGQVQDWLGAVIDGDPEAAGRVAPTLKADGYDMYFTRDLMLAKAYAMSRYASEPEKRYGLLASAKARNLRSIGIDNEFFAMRALKKGPWFNADRDDPLSSCQLTLPTTEFQCQGLELDLAVVCWGDDLEWSDGWVDRRKTRGAADSHRLRLNSYRVLLSRGRDGLVIYIPSTLRPGQPDALARLLRACGIAELH